MAGFRFKKTQPRDGLVRPRPGGENLQFKRYKAVTSSIG